MATLPSDPRQPPDGHEFPDFIENNDSVNHTITQKYFEDTEEEEKPLRSVSSINYTNSHKNRTLNYPERTKPSNLVLCHSVSTSNTDLRAKMYDSTEDLNFSSLTSEPTNLHTRSQSLIDMSSLSKQKNAKWNSIMEQRRKGLSKLKGLVIPEAAENEALPCVNIPEIKSQNTTNFIVMPKLDNSNTQVFSSNNNTLKSSIGVPPWSTNTSTTLPKYSPAFKRRSLQVYPTHVNRNGNCDYVSNAEVTKYCDKSNSKISKVNDDDINPPKSLESISSPTRSDCSFDYVSTTRKYIRETSDAFQKSHISKPEDESDNDSAVSSSQSSYNSRFSPPPSPTRSCELNHFKSKSEDDDKLNSQNRLLKPSSVEAINRKNILASAKCRSGKDLKIGSPVIRRKQEDKQTYEKREEINIKTNEETCVKNELRISDKANTALADVQTISKESDFKEIAKTPPAKIVEIEKTTPSNKMPPKNTFVPIKSPAVTPTKNNIEDTKENKITRDLYSSSSILSKRTKPINVKALKENFENFGSTPPPLPQKVPIYKPQISSRNVKAEIAKTENKIIFNNESAVKKNEKIEIKPKEIKPREIKPRKSSLEPKQEEAPKIHTPDTTTITLNLDILGGSLGITLAGGTDYESKEIRVHRIRYGSIAYHDGRLKRGDKIVSVNGKRTFGLTHTEAMELLKEPVTEFSIEVEEGKETVPCTTNTLQRRSSSMSVLSEPKSLCAELPAKKATNIISFTKDGAGLGFSIEGGKDSPQGDVPLTIKKIFTGGAADKCGQLKVGDEILHINDIRFTDLSRIEAWTLMKKIPDGNVNIHVFR